MMKCNIPSNKLLKSNAGKCMEKILHDVCVTGFGLLNAIGDSKNINQIHLDTPFKTFDNNHFPPYFYHPFPSFNTNDQIPRNADKRMMSTIMLASVYTSGLALKMAGLNDRSEFLRKTNLILAARNGNREAENDNKLLSNIYMQGIDNDNNNKLMMEGYRPTWFLAEIPNLVASNISIIHGVLGSSQTLLGEEPAGGNALKIAFERIKHGQSEIVLVGGSCYCGDPDIMNSFIESDHLLKGDFTDVYQRVNGGMCLGDSSAFLVLESIKHAKERGAKILVKINSVYINSDFNDYNKRINLCYQIYKDIIRKTGCSCLCIISGTSGDKILIDSEKELWGRIQSEESEISIINTCTLTGSLLEGAFPSNVVIGIIGLINNELFYPSLLKHFKKTDHKLSKMIIHCWGYERGIINAELEVADE